MLLFVELLEPYVIMTGVRSGGIDGLVGLEVGLTMPGRRRLITQDRYMPATLDKASTPQHFNHHPATTQSHYHQSLTMKLSVIAALATACSQAAVVAAAAAAKRPNILFILTDDQDA
jgi:hypothetical protein